MRGQEFLNSGLSPSELYLAWDTSFKERNGGVRTTRTSAVIALACWCAAGGAAAGFGGGSVLSPARAQAPGVFPAASHAATGEEYSWQSLVKDRSPGGEKDPRRSAVQADLDRAAAALAAGQYPEAVTAGEQALRALEAAPGLKPVELAQGLVWLGEIQWLAGDLARAELRLKRGLAILETALGTSHVQVAAARNKLAIVYQSQGLPGRAEPLHQRALTMQQAALGPDHVDVATSLNNLAILYKGQGLYERATPLYERALAIREKTLGSGHPDVAASLANLATLHQAQGLPGRAEELLRRALPIQEKALGAGHPTVALSLSHLSAVHAAQGRYAEAEPLARRALAIREKALGTGHPEVAASLGALAALALAQGDADRAEPLARRALAIREAALGQEHPDLAASLEQVAEVHLARKDLDGALPLLWRSLVLSEARLRREGLDFSELRLARFLQLLRADEERFYALLRAYPDDARVQRLALAVALLRKGRSVEETANTSRAVYRSLSLPDRDAFQRLRALRSQLARASLSGPGALDPAEYQQQLKGLADQGDALEARLARRSSRLRALTVLPAPEEMVDKVAKALPVDSALVELVAYADRAPGADLGERGPLRYLGLVLTPGARTRAVDLGPGEAIDGAVSRLRDALASQDSAYQAPATALEALVFRPLRPLLGGARRIFISPDGQLALAPFAALHDGKRFLVDSYDFTYLTSGKDLLSGSEEAARSRSVVVLANPDFGARPGGMRALPAADQRTAAERDYALAGAPPPVPRSALTRQALTPLPGTLREAESLRGLFPGAQIFLGAEATKERLLQVAAPGILHVATHGFFLEDMAAVPEARGVESVGPVGGSSPRASSNPLLRSGLVLAGADAVELADAGVQAARPDSAWVTALELAGVDLWGTQLVVLSACDTGRGDVRLGEGVYGLRRALVAAGAETLVMSLWKVNDETTHALMERYYRNLLDGEGRSAALRSAMQALRESQPHPFYWAPFISLGKDAPLELGGGG